MPIHETAETEEMLEVQAPQQTQLNGGTPPPPLAEESDEFWDNVIVPQNFTQLAATAQPVRIKTGRPNKKTFLRVHPEWTFDVVLVEEEVLVSAGVG